MKDFASDDDLLRESSAWWEVLAIPERDHTSGSRACVAAADVVSSFEFSKKCSVRLVTAVHLLQCVGRRISDQRGDKFDLALLLPLIEACNGSSIP